ncbi:nuclear transport factor 2 family protein [Rufibacter roseolus]|uniref:nuclear transport factor 2 family protein n=1 Tax=Rufibacter roseolus TaxID=2817375 RepID=UPI001B311744|nr:nuclear transport factor 2 family protein [Rufibacter roseolus]
MTNREEIIRNYIDSYNQFDVDRMVHDFDETIVFENISNGETNLSLTGLQAFKEQAEQAKNYFSSRRQTITSFNHQGNQTEIEIAYSATLATDLPNGLKKGEELNLQGKSIFTFSGDKIIKLTDIS